MAKQREEDRAKEGYAKALQRIEEAGQTRANELNLAGFGLTSLPPEIGALTALQMLNLHSNQLTSLPPEIGALTALQWLNLYNNQLTSLPPEIGALTALRTLDLHDNQLVSLPPEIGGLTALQWLDVFRNPLSSLPPKIGTLTALRTLVLSGNQLSSLPPEIRQLTKLEELFLHANPDLNLPPEVLGPTRYDVATKNVKPARPADILDYYFRTSPSQVVVAGSAEAIATASDPVVVTTDAPAFDIYIDPGGASRETLQELLTALSDLHIAAGGCGLEFSTDGTMLVVEEVEA